MRERGVDYRQGGPYFVTICTFGKRCVLGRVVGDQTLVSPAGAVVAEEWAALEDRFPDVVLDRFVVMPNHFHGLVGLWGRAPRRADVSLSDVIGAFKSLAARRCQKLDLPRLWQARFHDRLVRSEHQLRALRTYIDRNPVTWKRDNLFVPTDP